MTQNEKESLLSTFSIPTKWCKEMEACNGSGDSVSYDDPTAVAWDLTGGLCMLFGWDRAGELFPQLVRYVLNDKVTVGGPNASIQAMVALQEFNDSPETTHDDLLARIQTIPVWARGSRTEPPAVGLAQGLHGQGDE